jgi:hypothetical protein
VVEIHWCRCSSHYPATSAVMQASIAVSSHLHFGVLHNITLNHLPNDGINKVRQHQDYPSKMNSCFLAVKTSRNSNIELQTPSRPCTMR